MSRRVDRRIEDMQRLAESVLEEASSPEFDVARALAVNLRGYLANLREALEQEKGANGGAYWMLECLDLYEELRFTLPDADARQMGLGGAHAPQPDAVEQAAVHGRRYWRRQRHNAAAGADARWSGNAAHVRLQEIVHGLAARRDELGDPEPPGELWGALYGALDDAGLEPQDPEPDLSGEQRYYLYGSDGRRYNFGAFKKAVSRARKK
ncbi:MAG: hypothetical protein JJU06_06650 [Ectothiorhodospiraceae bacterium]|nr:hypothetical protein [Ectothiorhodospiraceae bacterium]MCH8504730.1 hypothetical protein [Ectothiorhodospiraceae bacterium]